MIAKISLVILGIVFFSVISIAGQFVYSTFLGGTSIDKGYSIAVDTAGNTYIAGFTGSTDFPTTFGTFDTNFHCVFVSKLNPSGTELIYSTYLGGNYYDEGDGIAVDAAGNAYITGYTVSTGSPDFPTTPGAFDTTFNGLYDAFVTKLNSTGTELVYSTYLGGSDEDKGNSIAIDVSGNAYVTGGTYSTDFPMTPGAFDTTFNGFYKAFVSKLNPSGTNLVYSTYLGGSIDDEGRGIAVDNNGNAYLTGYTVSTDFPTTPDAFDTTRNGVDDVFVSKLNPSGTGLVYSTYLGGTDDDYGWGIALDASGNAYITGFTCSVDFPTTPDSWDTSFNGGSYWGGDVFVSKLNPSGTALVYSTYLGGIGDDYGCSIAVDTSDNAYITGFTDSADFPTTTEAWDTSYYGANDVFVSKLNSTGTGLVYSTYLGGEDEDNGESIAVDASGNAYITGLTHSYNFPVTFGVLDTFFHGRYTIDAFVSKLSFGLSTATSPYLNSYGEFTVSNDTMYWYFDKYSDGIGAGTLSWKTGYNGQAGIVKMMQYPGEKGKLTQVFSIPATGWYTAIAKVATDIAEVSKQQKVYLYLLALDGNTTINACANQVIQPGADGFHGAGVWKGMEISFYAQEAMLGIQLVSINPTNSMTTGSLSIDDIWVYKSSPPGTNPVTLTNPGFNSGTTGWLIQPYADATTTGDWIGWNGLLVGTQGPGEKMKASQLCSCPSPGKKVSGSVWVYSGATTMAETQKVYLYLYSYDSGYNNIIESGNAILQTGKWTSNQWRKLQFEYTPFTPYNALQLVSINPNGNPYQAIYFDDVQLTQ